MATVYLRDFPADLHHKSKIRAAVDQCTLKDLVVNALQVYLDQENSTQKQTPAPEVSPRLESQSSSDAWSLAGIAISQMERISPDDPKRKQALLRVKAWTENELNWKSTKKRNEW